MKKTTLSIILPLLLTISMAHARTDSCQEQVNDLTRKIDIAKSAGNSPEVSRLEIALGSVNTYCTDGRQLNRAEYKVTKRQNKIKKAELEIQQAQMELEEARADGRASKIAKKEMKVKKKQLKLEEVRAELSQDQDDLKRLQLVNQ